MGSFNETCALSNLNIGCGTPVRLMFLTQNPYVIADQHETHRGCYHYDHWFARTPPIKGKYADYGDCAFKEGPITDLITECFQMDVIERPFGFNQCHSPDVTKTKGIHHFLNAAWEGRLLVQDDYTRERKQPPDHFPTWEKVHALLKAAKLPIQLESGKKEGKGGYNAQPVTPGVVCVTYGSFEDKKGLLEKAQKVLAKTYSCKIVPKFKDKDVGDYYNCLMVVPKGAFKNPLLAVDESVLLEKMTTHPEYRKLPVLAVMIREDVWQTYCKVVSDKKYPNPYINDNVPPSVDFLEKQIKKPYKGESSIPGLLDVCEMGFRESMMTLPFQTSVATHLKIAAKKKDFAASDELIHSCAELARIEIVMGWTHQPWYIPPLGGQDGMWSLKSQLLKDLHGITRKVLKKHQEELEAKVYT